CEVYSSRDSCAEMGSGAGSELGGLSPLVRPEDLGQQTEQGSSLRLVHHRNEAMPQRARARNQLLHNLKTLRAQGDCLAAPVARVAPRADQAAIAKARDDRRHGRAIK